MFLRHTLATLAYRAAKALRDAPDGFSGFRPAPGSRSAGEILAHLGDLMGWALSQASGEERWSFVRANPVLDPAKGVAMSVSVIHDVTASKLVEQRVEFLRRAGELLNATLDVQHTLGALAALAVPAFAGHVTVDLYEDGELRCVGARHVDPAKTELMT